jgi:putative endonuclease
VPTGRHALGSRGESLAATWYVRQGYEVLARNWRSRQGELDLVLRRGSEMVFCEVKARSDARLGSPAEAVTPTKQRRIRATAVAYLVARAEAGERRPRELRFDVACVIGREVDVIESAFSLPWCGTGEVALPSALARLSRRSRALAALRRS